MMDLDKDFLFPFRDIDDEEFVNINKDCVCLTTYKVIVSMTI